MGHDHNRDGRIPEKFMKLAEKLDLIMSRDGESDRAFKVRRARMVGELRAARESGNPIPELGDAAGVREFMRFKQALDQEEMAEKVLQRRARRKNAKARTT